MIPIVTTTPASTRPEPGSWDLTDGKRTACHARAIRAACRVVEAVADDIDGHDKEGR